METVLYADILFLIDFSMDFISLCITGSLMHEKMKALRVTAAAAAGGFTSVISVARNVQVGLETAFGIIMPFLMCRIAFGRRGDGIWITVRRGAIMWLSGTLLGGAVTALMSIGDGIIVGNIGGEKAEGTLLPIVIGSVVAVGGMLLLKTTPKAETAEAVVVHGNIKLKLLLLYDSGNLLYEPFSGAPVIVLSEKKTEELTGGLLPRNVTDCNPGDSIRIIPSEGVGGEKILLAFRPDEITVNGKIRDIFIASSPGLSFGGYDGIIPTSV